MWLPGQFVQFSQYSATIHDTNCACAVPTVKEGGRCVVAVDACSVCFAYVVVCCSSEGMFHTRVLCLVQRPLAVLSERDVVNVRVLFSCNYVV